MGLSARETAVQILHDIEEQGAFSNLALKKALWEQKQLDQRDKNLVTALVYGTEKHKLTIDHMIEEASNRRISRITSWTLAILRAGIFQIMYLDKVPSFAAVNESVELSKTKEDGKASGFVNGVLRKVVRSKETWDDKALPAHLRYSVPKKLFDFVLSFYGEEWTEAFFASSLEEAPMTLRCNTWNTDKNALKTRLALEGVEAWDGLYASQCLHTRGLQQIALMSSYRDGDFIIQDEGAMLSVEMLGVERGHLVLDMCAAPGGKTTHMAEHAGLTGRVVARDIHEHKLQLIEDNATRLGLHNILVELHDGLKELEEEDQGKYDRVLLDAPCSGLGILRRKPDIKYHLSPKKFHELVQMQKRMILHGFDALKPGGTMVYTTCTVNPRENSQVVEYLLRERPEAGLDKNGLPESIQSLMGKDGYIQLWPHVHHTDGFFMAKITKKEES
ncbi:16S rRNA (cytosine(967)-C(5))-methyltransferase RsmB [Alkalibacter rhizosphaerae]|uniref:16S rRNA (cytosine(967)-C(5))-methyltransferase n=1 Tax=Alkalibacter rhizosphaerae TaxID=2815577 RepID=A0A974XHB8_9FIRM|nr:16S rRNA (cytosine(967)-C(5))-methyltransferase RsmB [Alkalibacter rhizosphaerae]QSX08745.1 16S rRNA (cytosine(967)-C(5))-methyltransferase RsmB [Alkalibacter rhizosphaerae]